MGKFWTRLTLWSICFGVSYAASVICPKIFIVSMFKLEADVWHNSPEMDLLARNITVPGFRPLHPDAHCTIDGSICQLTTGQAEINAASSISALIFSPQFDLTSTYFLIAGIAGVSPKLGTLGSVAFVRYAVQVGLQHEFDAREMPEDFPSGFLSLGTTSPNTYPTFIDGTEVFELNEALRNLAFSFARTAVLSDSPGAQLSRSTYRSSPIYAAGAAPPSVVKCDSITSDTFWSGALLAESFENTTQLFTNGTGEYCMTQQEDNAILGALLRGALVDLVDFSRIIILRAGSNFDRPSTNISVADNLFNMKVGFAVAISNIGITGMKVVKGILDQWDVVFERGIPVENYVGDIFGSLGGEPDFGPGSVFPGRKPTWPGQHYSKLDVLFHPYLHWSQ